MAEDELQQLRSKAAELLLREEWKESVKIYTLFINLCHEQISKALHHPDPDHLWKLQKSVCLAFSNRAESHFRLRDYSKALMDCDEALKIEKTHFKSLLCKGKIFLGLDRYSIALDCFKTALIESQGFGNSDTVNGYLEKCKKLEFQSRTGVFDLSDWVVNGFRGKLPELAEFVGAVEIKRSEISGRGLFAMKDMDAGTVVVVTKAIAAERGILSSEDSGENEQLVMWKNFIEKVTQIAKNCPRNLNLINKLSNGEDEIELEIPKMSEFSGEIENGEELKGMINMGKILSILDVNSIVENGNSGKILGKNSDYYGVGLWVLASFINHSCSPNARRLHVGDYVIVHTSREVKVGEELTFAYFDIFSPLEKRKEMAKNWGFNCGCRRCKFEGLLSKQEIREIEMGIERGMDCGNVVYKLEEGMRKWMVKGKEKGYLRASFWGVYSDVYGSDKAVKRWGRRIPAMEVVVDGVVEVVGIDERVMKVLTGSMKKNGGGGGGIVEMEKVMKLGRGLYGKVVKKQALRILLEN